MRNRAQVFDYDRYSRNDVVGEISMRLDEFNVTTNTEVWAEVVKNKKVGSKRFHDGDYYENKPAQNIRLDYMRNLAYARGATGSTFFLLFTTSYNLAGWCSNDQAWIRGTAYGHMLRV